MYLKGKWSKGVLLLCCLLVCLGSLGLCKTAAAEKKRIAVLPFKNNAQLARANDLGTSVANALMTRLVKNQNYDVVERGELQRILQEQRLGLTGIVDAETAAEVGKLVGAAYSVFGSVEFAHVQFMDVYRRVDAEAAVKLTYRLVDNTTGRILEAEEVQGQIWDRGVERSRDTKNALLIRATERAIADLAQKINRQNPRLGNVMKVDGRRVYISIGSMDGIEAGDVCVIYAEGEPLYDPGSGTVVGVVEEKVAECVVQEAHERYAVAQLRQMKRKVEVGDKVKCF